MASRASRAGGRAGPSVSRPALTRTQLMRQAKSSAIVRDTVQDMPQEPAGGCPPSRKPRVPKLSRVSAAPPSPKKLDFKKPGLTKAMLARMKHAQKFQEDLEKKRGETVGRQQAKRRAAPVGGDARFGRDRSARRRSPCPPTMPEEQEWQAQGTLQEAAMRSKTVQKMMKAQAGRMSTAKRSGTQGLSAKTCQLARRMNAEVVQADPVGDGPVDNVVIPPGTINENRTTIVSINQGRDCAASATHRSMQIINQSLDEQDAAEAAAVQNKLDEMHQARRDLVMAVANMGGNTAQMAEQASMAAARPMPEERFIYKLPDIDDEILRPKYGRDEHPAIIAAREFRLRSEAELRQRELQRKMERDFARAASQVPDELRFDVPLEQDLMEGDISFEEDEETGMILPCPSRIKASMPPIPVRRDPCPVGGIGVDELERFFNVQDYPPDLEDIPAGPPPGREGLHPDLWDFDDPWVCPPPDEPDLIDFDSY